MYPKINRNVACQLEWNQFIPKQHVQYSHQFYVLFNTLYLTVYTDKVAFPITFRVCFNTLIHFNETLSVFYFNIKISFWPFVQKHFSFIAVTIDGYRVSSRKEYMISYVQYAGICSYSIVPSTDRNICLLVNSNSKLL